jgi:hypothetical protein
MSNSIGTRIAGTGMRLADTLHLRGPMRSVFRRLPARMRVGLGRLQVRVGVMDGLLKVPEEELERSFRDALGLVGGGGAPPVYLEFGVYVGTSMACMYHASMKAGAIGLRLIGFDSFQGMPAPVPGENVAWTWEPGQLYSDIDLTRSNLRRLGVDTDRIELVAGWYDETLTDATRTRLALDLVTVAMFDCVLSTSTRVALEFITPLIQDRVVLYFDDWAAGDLDDRDLGERKAFEEWLAIHPELTAKDLPGLRYGVDDRVFLLTRTATA